MNEELIKAFELIDGTIGGDNQELKTELTTKLAGYSKSDLNLDNVKKFLAENEAGTEYHGNTLATAKKDAIDKHMSSEEYLAAVKKAVDIKEEEVRKEFNKDLTPDQKKIKELEEKQKNMDSMLLQKEISFEAAGLLQDKKLHKDMLEFLIDGTSIETTKSNVEKMSTLVDTLVKQGVEAEFKKIGRDPNKGNKNTPQKITKKTLEDLAAKARATRRVEDRVKYAESKKLYQQQTNN